MVSDKPLALRRPSAVGPRDIIGFLRGRTPGQLVVQFTDHCNARCPQCGMRTTNRFHRTRLSSDTILKTIDAAAERGVKALSFTGGEPLLFVQDLASYIHHATRAGIPYVRTGTNGFIFSRPDSEGFERRVKTAADLLCGTDLRNFWISIDSADPATHERMRGFPGLIRGLEKALPWFHERGLYPSANLGLNRNVGGPGPSVLTEGAGDDPGQIEAFEREAEKALVKFYERVLSLGFTMVNTCYPMSLDETDPDGLAAVYAATSVDRVIRFTRAEKAALFRALIRVVRSYRKKVRIFSPLSSLHALIRHYGESACDSYPCRGGIDYFYVDARDGRVYPCGYRGNESFGYLWEFDSGRIDYRAECRKCDWECFRDPSELFGPVLEGLRHPWGMLRRMALDSTRRGLWLQDLSYYRACGFFDSRTPPNLRRMSRY